MGGISVDDEMTPEEAVLVGAFRKLQAVRDSLEFCCIDLSSDFNYIWDIKYVRYEHDEHEYKHFGNSDSLGALIMDFCEKWESGKLP